MQIWDTSGVERFMSIASSYFKEVHIIIYFVDASDRHSYQKSVNYIQKIHKNVDINNQLIALCVNKCDLQSYRHFELYNNELINLCTKYNISFYTKTFAKTGQNVEFLFQEAVDKYISKFIMDDYYRYGIEVSNYTTNSATHIHHTNTNSDEISRTICEQNTCTLHEPHTSTKVSCSRYTRRRKNACVYEKYEKLQNMYDKLNNDAKKSNRNLSDKYDKLNNDYNDAKKSNRNLSDKYDTRCNEYITTVKKNKQLNKKYGDLKREYNHISLDYDDLVRNSDTETYLSNLDSLNYYKQECTTLQKKYSHVSEDILTILNDDTYSDFFLKQVQLIHIMKQLDETIIQQKREYTKENAVNVQFVWTHRVPNY